MTLPDPVQGRGARMRGWWVAGGGLRDVGQEEADRLRERLGRPAPVRVRTVVPGRRVCGPWPCPSAG